MAEIQQDFSKMFSSWKDSEWWVVQSKFRVHLMFKLNNCTLDEL